MKNLAKFLLFVLLVSAGISFLYDYRIKHGALAPEPKRNPEKYTLANEPNINPKQIASLEMLNQERRALVKGVIPAVVAVKTSKRIGIRRQVDPFEFFFGQPRNRFGAPPDQALVQNSLGSGVVVTNEGHIITNNHVVNQVDEIEVQLSDGRTKKARLIGADSQIDLAVLKIDDPGVKPLVLADSDSVQVGDFVLAIGNPFGFDETVTDGIISYKGRTTDIGELLQTNAAINPGNSGGPLVNLRGEVIGINTAIISTSGASAGVGFAIPSNTVRMALESLLKKGRIIRGYLGIYSTGQQIGQNGNETGVLVEGVEPGSPAAKARLQRGDVIQKFNGRDVPNFPALRNMVANAELNRGIELEVVRNGKPMKVTTEIRERPAEAQAAAPAPQQNQPFQGSQPRDQDENETAGPLAGISVGDLTPELAQQLNLPANAHGVVITDVDPDRGVAELQKGDVIEEVNQHPVTSVADYKKIVDDADANQPQVLSVCRGRTRSFIVVRPQ